MPSLPMRLILAGTIGLMAVPAVSHAQVTTTLQSDGADLEFGGLWPDATKAVAAVDLGRVVDVDVRFDAGAACDGSAGSVDAPIVHARIGDVAMRLTAPSGTAIMLMAQRGGARDNVCSLVFDDDGGFPSIATLTAVDGQPVAGSFAPDDALSAFDGEDPNGGWFLQVVDSVSGVSGTFSRFTLVLQTAPVQDIVVDQLDDPAPNGCMPGSCSLREAVLLANTRPGLERILLPAGQLQLARAGADEDASDTGDLDVTDSLEIRGQGMDATTVLQIAADRLLHNSSGRVLTVRDLTLSGGKSVELGGAVHAIRRFVARSVRFSGNRASLRGGALFHAGGGRLGWPPQLELVDSEFDDNLAIAGSLQGAYGGAVYAHSSGFQPDHGLITGSTFRRNEADNGGGAIAMGAVLSVSNTGYLIRDSRFEDNAALDGHGGAIGTNLDENGVVVLTVLDSAFTGNIATGSAPEDHNGGAIRMHSGQLLRLARTVFVDNAAGRGGALHLAVPGLIEDSSFRRNSATHAGGAIVSGGLTLVGSTFERNAVVSTDTTDAGGGALATGADTTVTRSTFHDNSALRGGAITQLAGDLALRSNTFATDGTNLPPGADGTILRLVNTDASDNLSFYANIVIGRCLYTGGAIVPDVAAYNIEASGNTCRFNQAPLPAGNRVAQGGAAVRLGPLAQNGGPTETRMPREPSIAIDAAGNLGCPELDQRGYVRTDAMCDIGAVEASGVLRSGVVFGDGFES